MPLPPRLSSRTRNVMDLRRRGVPSVPVLGRYNYTHANPALPKHAHAGAMEICFLVRGRQTYCVRGERFHLRGGDVFLTFPNEEHSTGGAPEEKGLLYWMSLLDPSETEGSLLGLSVGDSRALWRNLSRRSRRHFSGNSLMKSHLDAVTQCACSSPSALSRIVLTNHLTGFLLAVVDARQATRASDERWLFQKVFDHIQANLEFPHLLSVDHLARAAGLSPSRFKISFKEETGIPPAEYALRARIAEAERRLAKSKATITEIAYELGFSSSQYFASAFKRLTNLTPREAKMSPQARSGQLRAN